MTNTFYHEIEHLRKSIEPGHFNAWCKVRKTSIEIGVGIFLTAEDEKNVNLRERAAEIFKYATIEQHLAVMAIAVELASNKNRLVWNDILVVTSDDDFGFARYRRCKIAIIERDFNRNIKKIGLKLYQNWQPIKYDWMSILILILVIISVLLTISLVFFAIFK